VTQERDWETAINAAEKLGGLHGLVNNAGICQPRTLMETDTELFERHMRVNQLGCFLGMKAVVSLMEQSGGGSIVNRSSVAGLRGSPGAIAYSATKWALRGMTKAAAIDLAPRRIRVNSVHPGPIDTEMLKVRTPEQNQQRLKLVPMKRMGTAEEVASLVLFLLSDESGYVTGARSQSMEVRHCNRLPCGLGARNRREAHQLRGLKGYCRERAFRDLWQLDRSAPAR
jgi:3alpha(or 20beta)-hydroxysteroid dehydrogenase